MNARMLVAIGILLATTSPTPRAAQAAEGCRMVETPLTVRGEGFKALSLQLRQGSVRIGSLEFSFTNQETGWIMTRPGDAGQATSGPPTQILLSSGALEIRSLDRKLGVFDEEPDAVLTAVAGERGAEIRITARGGATLELADGPVSNRTPRELAF